MSPLGRDDLIASYFTLTGTVVGSPPRFGFDERVAAAGAAGFAGIGMHFDDYRALRAEGRTDDDLRGVLDANGVEIAEIEFLWDWAYDDERANASSEMEADLLAMADAFSPHHLNIGDINSAADLPPLDLVTERFAAVCDRAAEHGATIALEFLPWSGLPDAATAWDVVRGADRPNGGILVDAWHYLCGRPDDAQLRSVPGARVTCVQLSDADAERDGDYMEDTVLRRRLPGDGALDLVGLVQTLDGMGVDVPYSVELMSTVEHALPVAEAAKRAYDTTRELLDRARGDDE